MKKVLVVDNDLLILEFFRELLLKHGYEVEVAKDGITALDILKTFIPDCIFLDLVMPVIDGRKLCHIVRGNPKLKDTYLVIISAIAAEEEINISELGANASIAKGPFKEMSRHILEFLEEPEVISSRCLSGEVPGVEGLHPREITKELLRIKNHFEVILERMSEGVLEILPEGRIVYANHTALSLLNMAEGDVLGSYFRELFQKHDQSLVDTLVKNIGDKSQTTTEVLATLLNDRLITINVVTIEGDESTSIIIILNDVTSQIRAEKALKQRNLELDLLNKASQALNSVLDLNQVLATVLEEVRTLMAVTGSTIWLTDSNMGDLVCRHATGPHCELVRGWRLKTEEGLPGWVVTHNESVIVGDSRTDRRHMKDIDMKTGEELRSILTVPLRAKQEVIGALQVVDSSPGRFDESHLTLLEPLATSAAIAIENARLYEKAQQEIEERITAESALRESEERGRALLNATSEIVLLTDTRGNILALNELTAQRFSKEGGELIGKRIFDLFPAPLIESAMATAEEVIRTGESIRAREIHEGRLYDTHYYPVFNTQKDVVQLAVFSSDVTEEVHIQEELKRHREHLEELVAERTRELTKINERLKQEIAERQLAESELKTAYDKLKEAQDRLIQSEKMAAMGRLAGGLAHQIRNPLEIVLMGVDFLSNSLEEKNENTETSIQKIRQAVGRTNKIITDFLRFSRTSEFIFESLDICKLLDETVSLMEHRAFVCKVKISQNYAERPMEIRGDKNMLQQVFINLFNNAFDAMTEGGEINIKVYDEIASEVGNKVGYRTSDYFRIGAKMTVIEIGDTGMGIPADVLPRVFEPFFTTKEREKGTGLGLSLAHSMVDRHQGIIDVRSEVDKGTIFTIRLQPSTTSFKKVKNGGEKENIVDR